MSGPEDEPGLQILFEVSTAQSGRLFAELAAACSRKRLTWGCFFTNDGVTCLGDNAVCNVLEAASSAVACEFSWDRFMPGAPCPIEIGSQTNNSSLLGRSLRVVSL